MHLRPWRPQANKEKQSSPGPSPSPGPSLHPPRRPLTDSQRRMYKLEKGGNFRWIARLLSSPSSRVLTNEDLVPHELEREVVDLGQYVEVAHGSIDLEFIWRNLSRLVQPTFPLEGYNALEGSTLVCVFHGEVAKLRGYIAYQPTIRQLVIAISGTSSPSQALRDVDARMVPYSIHGNVDTGKEACKVHRGFWHIYRGLRKVVLEKLSEALSSLDISELVITGHSLGAAQATLFLMELLQNTEHHSEVKGTYLHPPGMRIKVFGFGSPRIGNEALASYYCKLVSQYQEKRGEESLQEYLIKGYNDGVPCLPPKALGFRHATASALYSFHGRLYHIPFSEREHSVFPVQLEDEVLPPEFPLGGHNYYCNRDMEKFLRGILCLDILKLGEAGWEERYKRYRARVSRGRT